jgi:uncharacterized protein (DUF1501 family)
MTMHATSLHRDRRRFMTQMAAMASTPMLGGLMQAAYAAGPFNDYRALVCVFLFGGNDSHNLIIPLGTEYAGYAAGRANLAIPQASAIPVSAGLSGRSFGFHPSLTGLAGIFNTSRKLACVNNVSVLLQPTTKAQYNNDVNLPPQLFSHSDMQSHWQTGRADYPAVSGWGGRLADLIESANGNSLVSVSVTAAGQNLFQKGNNVVSYAVSGWQNTRSAIVRRLRAYRDWDNYSAARPNPQAKFEAQLNIPRTNLLEDQWGDMAIRALNTGEFVNGVLYNLDSAGNPVRDASGNVSEKFPIAPAPPMSFVNSSGATQANRLAGQLRSVANMIAARDALGVKRQIFFVSLGGFDNHGDQFKNSNNPTTPILSGLHADLLKQLDQALTWFYDWTVSQGIANNVTTFTASDFGRTLTSNGLGSDHGWGGHYFVLGGAVDGGKFYGGPAAGDEFPLIALNAPLDVGQGRLLPTTSVDEYGATFAKWMGASNSDVASVFPNLSRFARPTGMSFLA